MMRFFATVSWVDRRGASCSRSFSDCRDLGRFLDQLRREATIRNYLGEKIGAVEFAPDLHDDRRRKWVWYYDGEGANLPAEAA